MENIKMDDILIGSVLQSYSQKGCKFCNSDHPDYEDIFGIQKTANGVHYITLIMYYDKECDKYNTVDMEVYYCHECGRKL